MPSNRKVKLPHRISKARRKLGLSQVELAALLHVSPGTVACWETDSEHHHGIRKNRLAAVARVLGLDVMELLS